MNLTRNLRASIAGGAIAAMLLGCGETKNEPAGSGPSGTTPSGTTPSGSSATTEPTSPTANAPAGESGKGTEAAKPSPDTPTPAVIEQPAAPTQTPADAAKDKSKAGGGEVKKETPPNGG